MQLIDQAKGHQEQTGAEVEFRPQEIFEAGEFNRRAAAARIVRVAGGGVLEFNLGVDQQALGEFVAKVKDETDEVEFIVRCALIFDK